jgi:hypothetical protein
MDITAGLLGALPGDGLVRGAALDGDPAGPDLDLLIENLDFHKSMLFTPTRSALGGDGFRLYLKLAALAAIFSSPEAIIPPGDSVERGTLKKPETQHGASGIGVWVGTKSIQPLLGFVFGEADFGFFDLLVDLVQIMD